MKQILDRVIALLIVMSNLAKPIDQKGVNDRSEKNNGRHKVERFPLNPPREFSEKGRNLLVMVAIDRQRKIYGQVLSNPAVVAERVVRHKDNPRPRNSNVLPMEPTSLIVPSSREPVVAAEALKSM